MLLPSNAGCVLVQMCAQTLRDAPAHRRMSRHVIGALSMSRIASVPQTVASQLAEVLPASPESLQVQLVHSGRMILQQDDRETEVGAGELVVYDVSRPFAFVYPETFRTTILQVPRELVGVSGGTLDALSERAVPPASAAGALVSSLVSRADAVNDQLDENSRGAVSRAVVDALGLLARERRERVSAPAPHREALISAALEHVRRRIFDPGLSVAAIAHDLHVSVRTLHAAFEDERETLGRTIRRLRLDRARHQLDTTDVPVQAIAQQVGYLDVTHFIRAFKSAEGLTPSQWRRRRQGGRGGGSAERMSA